MAMAAAVGMVWAGPAASLPAPMLPGYQVQVGPDAATLTVEATFPPGTSSEMVSADGGERFVRDLAVDQGGRWSLVSGTGDGFTLPGCTQGCRIRYRFLLREAAEALDDPETAASFAGAIVSPPSTWLLRPASMGLTGYRLRVSTPAGIQFLSGLPRGAEPDTYQVTGAGLRVAPMCAFGRWRSRTLSVGASRITLAIAPVPFAMRDDAIEAWVAEAARAVAAYDGHFPVAELLLVVAPAPGQRLNGVTLGEGGASILIRLGVETPAERARSHWVMTHELMHLGFPSMRRTHQWIEEGMAVFGEPLARVRAGMVDRDLVWSEWLEQGALGLPRPGDSGLERTHTWARTYWGGALFWLLVDVTLRERTGNARSADDILRALVDAGGTVSARWEMDAVLRTADAAAGLPVFSELFRTLAEAPGKPNLGVLWKRLGIALVDGAVVYDDTAPLAAVRKAMTAPVR